jgi:hypothetical protein
MYYIGTLPPSVCTQEICRQELTPKEISCIYVIRVDT